MPSGMFTLLDSLDRTVTCGLATRGYGYITTVGVVQQWCWLKRTQRRECWSHLAGNPNHPESLDRFDDFSLPLVHSIVDDVLLAEHSSLGKIEDWKIQKRMTANPTQTVLTLE